MLRAARHVLLFLGLTLATQIGGLAYLISLVARPGPGRRIGLFVMVYAAGSLGASVAAPLLGRVPLDCFGALLRPQSPVYCALNRHYVTPALAGYAQDLAASMDARFPGTVTLALDANFPFLDGFPLLPHLSHDDGGKLDLAFYYRSADGYAPGQTSSPIGYWAFEAPHQGAARACAGRDDALTLRWDMGWLWWMNRPLTLDRERLTAALNWLTSHPPAGYGVKILLEPHLAARLGVSHPWVRFQGCRAARHDDHIHIQLTGV